MNTPAFAQNAKGRATRPMAVTVKHRFPQVSSQNQLAAPFDCAQGRLWGTRQFFDEWKLVNVPSVPSFPQFSFGPEKTPARPQQKRQGAGHAAPGRCPGRPHHPRPSQSKI